MQVILGMAGFSNYFSEEKKGRLSRNVVTGVEYLSWNILKLFSKKGSTVLQAQANLQLQSWLKDVPLLDKTQQGFQ